MINRQELVAILVSAEKHLQKWIDLDLCECEGGHSCGRDKVEANVAEMSDAITSLQAAEPDHPRLRQRFDEIEREICEGKHTASSVFTQMRTAAFYTTPQPAEQKPDVTQLVEALEWYAEHAAGCRKISSEGDKHRSALDADGGSIAETALSAYREQQGVEP